MQYIRFTADLAVLYITLFAPGRRVNRGLIPLSTPGTLESTDHANIYRTPSYRWDEVAPGIEPVLQRAPPQFFSICRVSSSAYVESVLQRVVRQFLRRVLLQFFAIFPHQLFTHLRSG
jgi:hypothetical protein